MANYSLEKFWRRRQSQIWAKTQFRLSEHIFTREERNRKSALHTLFLIPNIHSKNKCVTSTRESR